jgi:hypothetical protein
MDFDKQLNQTMMNEQVHGMGGHEIKESDNMEEQDEQENQGWIQQNIMDQD